jgi:hypothetical protein
MMSLHLALAFSSCTHSALLIKVDSNVQRIDWSLQIHLHLSSSDTPPFHCSKFDILTFRYSGVHTVLKTLSSRRTGSPSVVPTPKHLINVFRTLLRPSLLYPSLLPPNRSTPHRYFLKVFEGVDKGARRRRKEEGTARVW